MENLLSDTAELDLGEEVGIQEIPSLVVEIFIRNLHDLQLLKTCRLVCKYWNTMSCETLRNRCCVRLLENSQSVVEFKKLFLMKPTTTLSSPFRDFEIDPCHFTDLTFKELVYLPSVVCKELRINFLELRTDAAYFRELKNFLVTKQNQIKNLTLINMNLIGNGAVCPGLISDEIEFSSVKSLNLHSWDNVTNGMEFVKTTMRKSVLECLFLQLSQESSLIDLLTFFKLEKIKDLCVRIEDDNASGNVWNVLNNLHLPELKILDLDLDISLAGSKYNLSAYNSFFQKVAPNLRKLTANGCPIPEGIFFPKLHRLEIGPSANLSIHQFSMECFPLLENFGICILAEDLGNFMFIQPCPHSGVKILIIEILFGVDEEGQGRNQRLLDWCFQFVMTELQRQFPNVTDFSIEFATTTEVEDPSTCNVVFRQLNLIDIHKNYPCLEKLSIRAISDFHTITGTTMDYINKYLELGLPIEHIPRRMSVHDFYCLESLIFYDGVSVTFELIAYCLAKIPTLKYLSFNVNDDLPATVVRDYLQHVSVVEVRPKLM